MRYENAIVIATAAHRGQVRRGDGADYITHPIAVADQFDDNDEKVVSVFHDIVEDDLLTLEQLRAAGASELQLTAIDLMSRRKLPDGRNEVYMADFIERIATAPGEAGRIVRNVKRADIWHNRESLQQLPPEERDIERRYERADRRIARAQKEFGEAEFLPRHLRPSPSFDDGLSF